MPSRRARSLERSARSRTGAAVIKRRAATTRQAAARMDAELRVSAELAERMAAHTNLSAVVAEQMAEQVDRAFTGLTRGMQQISAAGRAAGISIAEFTRVMDVAREPFSIAGVWSPYSAGGVMPWPRPVDSQGHPVEDARVTTLAGRPIDPNACICGDLTSRRGAWLQNCPRASQHEAARDRWSSPQERVEQVQQGVRRDNMRAIRVRDDHGR